MCVDVCLCRYQTIITTKRVNVKSQRQQKSNHNCNSSRNIMPRTTLTMITNSNGGGGVVIEQKSRQFNQKQHIWQNARTANVVYVQNYERPIKSSSTIRYLLIWKPLLCCPFGTLMLASSFSTTHFSCIMLIIHCLNFCPIKYYLIHWMLPVTRMTEYFTLFVVSAIITMIFIVF